MCLHTSFVFVRLSLCICVCVCPSLQEAADKAASSLQESADKVRGAKFEEIDPKNNPQVSFSPSLLLAHKHKTPTSVNAHIIFPWLSHMSN